MKLTVIGTGYVGLVTGTCFAEMGNKVLCLDIDADKVSKLNRGVVPIYEPGLEELVKKNLDDENIRFLTDSKYAIEESEIIFIAVGTPLGQDGTADLDYVLAAAREIGKYASCDVVVVVKSTVPVNSNALIRECIQKELTSRCVTHKLYMVSNPEFLKEGMAVEDCMKPDRVIIGIDSSYSEKVMRELYKPFFIRQDNIIFMDIPSAEMTKYAANAMLACRISFMNEIAGICERLGADIDNVRRGIGSDSRIGFSFLYSGVGYGGSCFSKDLSTLIKMSHDVSLDPKILESVEKVNESQKLLIVHRIVQKFGEQLVGRKFALWGLSFKPNTDDMRDAPSIVIVNELIKRGAEICAFDPKAHEQAKQIYFKDNPRITYAKSKYAALDNADALILVTEWLTFRAPDFEEIKYRLKHPIIYDGRNQYSPSQLREFGFQYYSIGRQ